ncbi:beta-glucosidase [Acrocarpospora corrugata]|uniref:Beta-glucosidase n=1 Tax=Acrocarpospora corrugata TaxID=35763 RepID=A0A5M3VRE2_9ACTN|nr:glycoside hydrolase family 3 C-terminal domain-containing protein [Acrocarpospora corrugata]GER98539.1 beta-glucosidase [Acrocarpospora corrugata]
MDEVTQALGKLDLDTKAGLLAGADMWTLPAIPEIGLDALVMSDGPIGVRGMEWTATDPSIALPSPTALAATWDVALARRVGGLLAQEARRKGVHVLLAPTVNLHRSPLGGRHFECYSEDPLLSGEIAAGYVIGVQERGVAVTVKHFVANDSETERLTVNVLVGERALRELYLAPFEIVNLKAGPYGVMAAYNRVNGPTMTEHDELQNRVLRDEWGFDGFIVSDWTAAHDTVRAANGGLDVAMPGPKTVYGPALADAVRAGEVTEEVLDEHVLRVLTVAARTGALRTGATRPEFEDVDGEALAREVAARSFTLLRNEGVLPLPAGTSIALIGGLAKDARVMGGGSAQVYSDHVVSPLDGLKAAGLDVTFARGADPSPNLNPARDGFAITSTARAADGHVLGTFPQVDGMLTWIGKTPVPYDELHTVEIGGTFTPDVDGAHEFAIDGLGAFRLEIDGELLHEGVIKPPPDRAPDAIFIPTQKIFTVELTAGRPVDVLLLHTVYKGLFGGMPLAYVGFGLAHREPRPDADELLARAEAAARAADVAVVVVGTSKEVESEGFDRHSLRLPERQDELVARVVAANPKTIVVVNAGAPVEMPWRNDVAATLLTWFPGQEGGHALADVLTGAAEPGGRLPTTWPVAMADCPVIDVTPRDGEIGYDEGVFIGYRAWDRTGAEPAYAFGHGLGYTTWIYESISYTDGTLTVGLRNTGTRSGREVVQAYLAPVAADESRPARWLAGFAVAEAGPGTTVEVTIEIPRRAAEIWTDSGWQLVGGDYLLTAAHSLTDPRLILPITF